MEFYGNLFEKWNAAAEFIVAYNENILGYAVLYANNYSAKMGYITLIAVRPEYQNKHIGRALLTECELIAKNRGMDTLKLEVNFLNEKAIMFYEKNGFAKSSKNGTKSFYMIKHLFGTHKTIVVSGKDNINKKP